MINKATMEMLNDIFANSDTLDKISVELDPITRSLTVVYWDLDDEWFNELITAKNATHD